MDNPWGIKDGWPIAFYIQLHFQRNHRWRYGTTTHQWRRLLFLIASIALHSFRWSDSIPTFYRSWRTRSEFASVPTTVDFKPASRIHRREIILASSHGHIAFGFHLFIRKRSAPDEKTENFLRGRITGIVDNERPWRWSDIWTIGIMETDLTDWPTDSNFDQNVVWWTIVYIHLSMDTCLTSWSKVNVMRSIWCRYTSNLHSDYTLYEICVK